jgi:hypothetical protein
MKAAVRCLVVSILATLLTYHLGPISTSQLANMSGAVAVACAIMTVFYWNQARRSSSKAKV